MPAKKPVTTKAAIQTGVASALQTAKIHAAALGQLQADLAAGTPVTAAHLDALATDTQAIATQLTTVVQKLGIIWGS